MDKKYILVTGGAGYIGSHTTRFLLDKGFNILVIDNLSNGHEEFIDKRAEFVLGDIGDFNFLDDIFSKFDILAVVHFASFIEVGESVNKPLKYYQNNVSNSLVLFSVMQKFGVDKIVFSSTAAVYGEPKVIPIKENDLKKPTNPYGQSKLFIEKILDDLDFKSICLRYFNASGASYEIGEWHTPETHLIPLVLFTALGKRDKICIFGDTYDTFDGTCIRDYVHVLDLARAHFLSLSYLLKGGVSKKYNLGSSNGYSVKEVINMCKKVTGVDFKVEILDKRKGDPAKLIADSSKIYEDLGWRVEFNLEEIISSAWEWHKKER